ncbi:DNA mismatch repair endonuclease MutL [Leuconostocaceae bacterium ESL0958]|nr:DNA mismatch repair endonuclease MutL [Leuconostocaceae bacterium ESL0958]
MAKIHELSTLLANQIAAGEVIERPASVIKELVENAIDAGASQVEIVVERAGLDLMKVVDNGQGIAAEDVPLAFVRHATSKITDRHDLFQVQTLGFRGEALPSIAAVAEVSLQSRAAGAASGYFYQIQGGQVLAENPGPGRFGTTVAVRHLFYNTPARLKYLKKPATELAAIVDAVNHLALANPAVALTLTHNGKPLLKTAGNGRQRQVLATIYGRELAQKLLAFEGSSDHFAVSGLLSLPEQTRASRSYLSVFVNHRFVKNFSVSNAVIKGYGSKLMVGRFPIGVINISLDPLLVDVNVHPQKAEIRLTAQEELTDLLTTVVAERLAEENLIPDALANLQAATAPAKKAPAAEAATTSPNDDWAQDLAALPAIPVAADRLCEIHQRSALADEKVQAFQARYQEEGLLPIFATTAATPAVADRLAEEQVSYESVPRDRVLSEETTATVRTNSPQPKAAAISLDLDDHAGSDESTFPRLDYIGQMHGTFLFAQSDDKLYLIDQHAAQERLNYEYFRKAVGEVSQDQQQLLTPITLTYANADLVKLRDRASVLQALGIDLQDFGANTVAVYEHPTWMKAAQAKDTIQEMVDWVLQEGQLTVAEFREKTAIMMSCKRAIKANWHLSDEQAKALLADLSQAQNPYNCPHGRPVLISFTLGEMEKMFKRIQDSHESWQNYDQHPF